MLLVSLIVAVVLGAWPAWAKSCHLPTESELGLLDLSPPPGRETWTLQENWIWKQTLAGEVADFNQLYCEKEPLDPSAGDAVWQNGDQSAKPRQVSERFLVDVLTKKRFAEAVTSRGLRIVGALFTAPIDLSGVKFDRQIWLDRSRFLGPVSLTSAQLGSLLSLGVIIQGVEEDAPIGRKIEQIEAIRGTSRLADRRRTWSDLSED